MKEIHLGMVCIVVASVDLQAQQSAAGWARLTKMHS